MKRPGFRHRVSLEQIEVFASTSVDRRLEWLEEMRVYTWSTASAEVRARWMALRAHPPTHVPKDALRPCPCCDGFTIPPPLGAGFVCPRCDWEDCPVQRRDPDEEAGPNRLSLRQARRRWRERQGR